MAEEPKKEHKGTENLKVIHTKERAREIGRKGGIACGEARRKRRTMKEQLEMIVSLPLKSTKTKDIIKKLGIEDNDINNQMALNYALFIKALKGDMRAYEIVRDMLGENPALNLIAEETKESKVIVEVVDNSKLEKSLYKE